jgi:hypothetical protein
MGDQDIILGTPWLRNNRADILHEGPALEFRNLGIRVGSIYEQRANIIRVSAAAYAIWTSQRMRKYCGIECFSASLADIEKALAVKKQVDPREKLPEHYHR